MSGWGNNDQGATGGWQTNTAERVYDGWETPKGISSDIVPDQSKSALASLDQLNDLLQNASLDEGNDKCFGCGQRGHIRADCPSAEDNVCRYCKRPGHMVKECPDKPPMICDNCGQEGHAKLKCENPRLIDREHIADMPADKAWDKIKSAASERDVDDVKEAIQEYIKAVDGAVRYRDLQESFIRDGINLWLIGLERPLIDVYTNMDIQGNTGKKYTISYRFSERPSRPRERDGWPQDRQELLNRLDNAGDAVDGGIPKCVRCKQLGHVLKHCTIERQENEDAHKTMCYNCGSDQHRVRDCPEPRVDRFACKNCGKSGHKVAECPEEPNAENVECRRCHEKGHFAKDCPNGRGGGGSGCRNCGQEGHMSRDCDQPENMDNVTCHNCDKTGHRRRDCPLPTDWSKVQCTVCQEYGHTRVRCQKVPPDDILGGANQGFDNVVVDNGAGWESSAGPAVMTTTSVGGW